MQMETVFNCSTGEGRTHYRSEAALATSITVFLRPDKEKDESRGFMYENFFERRWRYLAALRVLRYCRCRWWCIFCSQEMRMRSTDLGK